MRRISICVLSLFMASPAFCGARLPVVNIASGGVSARALFGEEAAAPSKKIEKTAPVTVAGGEVRPTRTRAVVARTSVTPALVDSPSKTASVDVGGDVLSPRRPSNDLWAKSDTALRMPRPNEFAVIRSDAALPEESLDSAPKIAVAPVVKPMAAPVVTTSETSEKDAQLARLNDLQRRANDSVRTVSPRTIMPLVADSAPSVAPAPTRPVRVADAAPATTTESVSLRRLVVPMDDDVIVRSVEKNTSPRITAVRDDMTKMTPSELRRAFRKTFLSENKHLSTYSIDERFDVASDMSSSIEGFTAQHDLSESGGIRPLEIKIKFRNEDSALSRENYTLLTEYAGIVVGKPTRAIQVAIPQFMTTNKDARKLAARRLAIVEQVLTDNGVSRQRIVPVLSNRDEQGFVLRIISGDQYDTLTEQKRDIFGDTIGNKTYKSMSW